MLAIFQMYEHVKHSGGAGLLYWGGSPQRLECYLSSTEDKQLLKKFSETRWSQHDLCLASLLVCEPLSTLDLVQQVRDPKARSTAGSLSKALDPFPFLVCAVTCRKLLQYLTPLSTYLQAPAVDLVKASSQASHAVSILPWDQAPGRLAPWVRLGSRDGDCRGEWHNSDASQNSSASEAQVQHTCFDIKRIVALDWPCILRSLTTWSVGWNNNHATQCRGWKPSSCSLQSFPCFQMNTGARSRMTTRRWCQTSRLQTLNLWKRTTSNVETDDLCTLLEHSKLMFPNVHSILKILLLTMPVSTATAKRSFSCLCRFEVYRSVLGRLKTYC